MPGGGSLVIRTANAPEPEGNGHVVLEVRDTGAGMDEEALARWPAALRTHTRMAPFRLDGDSRGPERPERRAAQRSPRDRLARG